MTCTDTQSRAVLQNPENLRQQQLEKRVKAALHGTSPKISREPLFQEAWKRSDCVLTSSDAAVLQMVTQKRFDIWQGEGQQLASNQVQYSLLYRVPETNGVVDSLKESGASLIAYSPLCQGLLTGALLLYKGECALAPCISRLLHV